jgi:hypothetical protein
MSFQSAKQFIIDFYANPVIRIKVSKIQNKNISKIEQLNQLLQYAKYKGYSFSLFDLIKAVKFKKKLEKLNTNELVNVFGGSCLNYDIFNRSNKNLQPIENMIPPM